MSEAKKLAAEKAIDHVEDGMVVGVGTGSTVAYFIDALGKIRHRIAGAVSSSEQSTARLKALGIEVLDLNEGPPKVVRRIGWLRCMCCARFTFSDDVVRVRMCEECGGLGSAPAKDA